MVNKILFFKEVLIYGGELCNKAHGDKLCNKAQPTNMTPQCSLHEICNTSKILHLWELGSKSDQGQHLLALCMRGFSSRYSSVRSFFKTVLVNCLYCVSGGGKNWSVSSTGDRD